MRERIVLSLISHTNIGKTSLARTLLRSDIGTVGDRPHVTDENTSHVLVQTDKTEVILWDTPGFGNVRKLLKRFQNEGNAWNWLQTEVVDRMLNRSFYCSIEAARNVRQDADVVLYLVNVREEPQDAGYIPHELELIERLGKPVLMLLNQVPLKQLASEDMRNSLLAKWRAMTTNHACVKDILILDAFHRFQNQEVLLLTKLEQLLDGDRAKAIGQIRRLAERNRRSEQEAVAKAAFEVLVFASQQRISPEKISPEAAVEQLSHGLQEAFDSYLDQLMAIYKLHASAKTKLEESIRQVTGSDQLKLPAERTGIISAILGGASSGLAADLMAGGLTFGGGMLLGAIGGFLGGYSLAKVSQLRKPEDIGWQPQALSEMIRLLFIYYVLAAMHGRGKGDFIPDENRQLLADYFEPSAKAFEDKRTAIAKMLVKQGEEKAVEIQAMLEQLFQDWYDTLAPVA
jgi:GTPase Era involved in 16S rRNA processing